MDLARKTQAAAVAAFNAGMDYTFLGKPDSAIASLTLAVQFKHEIVASRAWLLFGYAAALTARARLATHGSIAVSAMNSSI